MWGADCKDDCRVAVMTVLRISSAAAAAFVASLLFPMLSANSQPNWQQRLEQLDHTVARAFQGVKKCVARELEHGSYHSNVDDALRVILVRNCRRQYDAFFPGVCGYWRGGGSLLGLRPVLDRRSVQGAILPMNPVQCRPRTPVKKVAKALKRTVGALRQKALSLGLPLGHRR